MTYTTGSSKAASLSPTHLEKWSASRRTWAVLIVAATGVNLAIQFLGGSQCHDAWKPSIPEEHSQGLRREVIAAAATTITTPEDATIVPIFTPAPAPVDTCRLDYERRTAQRTEGLTTEDLKRSNTYNGNRYRLARLGKTLNSFKENPRPINMVVSGGSITLGHGVETRLRYSNRLEDWLNQNFPLQDPNTKHKVLNKGSHGADICAMAKRLNILMRDLPKDIDLFVLEFAVNDYQGQDHTIQIDFKMDVFFDGFQQIAHCTEAVLAKLLRHYPNTAVMLLEMRTAILQRKTASIVHVGAAHHYQVPIVSYDQAMFPGYQYLLQLLKPFNYSTAPGDTVLPYPHGCHPCIPEHIDPFFRPNGCANICVIQRFVEPVDCALAEGRAPCTVPFFAHDEVHPSGIGHQIAADLIIERIASTARDLCEGRDKEMELIAPMPTSGWMVSKPALLDAQSAFLMVNDTFEIFVEKRPLHAALNSPGFTLYDDAFGRTGWIATNEAGGESVQFDIRLPEGECYVPYLAVLKSYEKMGTFSVTVLDRTTQASTTVHVDGLWSPRISVPSDIQLISDGANPKGCTGNCQVTVTTNPMIVGRSGNKVKIITLSVRRCVA